MRFVIAGRLPSMNEFIKANRTNVHVGNKMKKDSEALIASYIPKWKLIGSPVKIHYRFYEANKRRDLDKVASYAIKVIQDALVRNSILVNDGWEHVLGFTVEFFIDKENPRIEVDIHEVINE